MRIVIPGGSGQVGHILARHFHAQGHEVTILSRRPMSAQQPWQTIQWDHSPTSPWTSSLDGAGVCINLAGRSVNCRYNAANRETIYRSRVETTQLLQTVIANLPHPPHLWINASTATIYRHALDRPMDEATGELGGNEPGAPSTWSFSIRVAKAWEEAFFAAPTPRTRKVAIRSAMTFSPDHGGVFDVFLRLVRFGLGGTQGPGTQYVSWIHDLDFARAITFLIEHEAIDGAINISSPNPLPNRDFMRALRSAWGAPLGLPAPALAIEAGALLLQTESELVLKSRRVIPTHLLSQGFQFTFPHWADAARDLVKRWRAGHAV